MKRVAIMFLWVLYFWTMESAGGSELSWTTWSTQCPQDCNATSLGTAHRRSQCTPASNTSNGNSTLCQESNETRLISCVRNETCPVCNPKFTAYFVLGLTSVTPETIAVVQNELFMIANTSIMANNLTKFGFINGNMTSALSDIELIHKTIYSLRLPTPQASLADDINKTVQFLMNEQDNRRVLVIITDDLGNRDNALASATRAKDDNITVVAVGITEDNEINTILIPRIETGVANLSNLPDIFSSRKIGEIHLLAISLLDVFCKSTTSNRDAVEPFSDLSCPPNCPTTSSKTFPDNGSTIGTTASSTNGFHEPTTTQCNLATCWVTSGNPATNSSVSPPTTIYIGIGVAVAVVFVLIAAVLFLKRRRIGMIFRRITSSNTRLYESNVTLQSRKKVIDLEKCENMVPAEKIQFLETLGQGHFGQVMKARVYGILHKGQWDIVAVKVCKDNCPDAAKEDLRHEIKMMQAISPHPNIVNYIHFAIDSNQPLLFIEYTPLGSLLEWLRKKRPQTLEQTVTPPSYAAIVTGPAGSPSHIYSVLEETKVANADSNENADYHHVDSNSGSVNYRKENEYHHPKANANYSNSKYHFGHTEYHHRNSQYEDLNNRRGDTDYRDENVDNRDENAESCFENADYRFEHADNRHGNADYRHGNADPRYQNGYYRQEEPPTPNDEDYWRAEEQDDVPVDLSASSVTSKQLTMFAHQVTKGMRHLQKNKIIHRDLAARNVLLTANLECKVSDFGLSRNLSGDDIYETHSAGSLPIRWMAPESLQDRMYTVKSDVWSYGVLLWEIVTLGASPYPGLSARQVMKTVIQGDRMARPEHCASELYDVMTACWKALPDNRPDFVHLCNTLDSLLEESSDYIRLSDYQEGMYGVISSHYHGHTDEKV